MSNVVALDNVWLLNVVKSSVLVTAATCPVLGCCHGWELSHWTVQLWNISIMQKALLELLWTRGLYEDFRPKTYFLSNDQCFD